MAFYLPGIFSLLVATAGWFYLFYSRAAQRMAGLENADANRRRVMLRRIGGFAMCMLGIGFFAGSYTFNVEEQPTAFITTWLVVMLLLVVLTISALLDLRITMRLRRKQQP